jgi:type IV pilus assembly protein PilX
MSRARGFTTRTGGAAHRPGGFVLISSLLLLIVVTILAMAMFRSFGLDEKIGGNVREKGRALNAAESAQQYAEWWLAQGNGSTGIACASVVSSAVGQVCANPIGATNAAYLAVPWAAGVTYTPPGMTSTVAGAAATPGSYYAPPVFYIQYLGLTPAGNGSVFKIDAVGYGGSPNAIAIVESTYAVVSGVKDLGAG